MLVSARLRIACRKALPAFRTPCHVASSVPAEVTRVLLTAVFSIVGLHTRILPPAICSLGPASLHPLSPQTCDYNAHFTPCCS